MSVLGTIARYWPEKRFGFITPDGVGEDTFFHITVVDSPIEAVTRGARVEFDSVPSEKGPRCSRVVVFEDPYADSLA